MTTLPQLFRRFTQNISPRLILGSVTVALALRVWLGAWSWKDAAVVAALTVYWPVHEWLLHVFVLHSRPKKLWRWTIDFPEAKAHREHHQDPWNLDLAFVPARTYMILPVIWTAWLVSPLTLEHGLTGIAAYFALSLQYEWIHFLTHTRYVPRGALYRRLWLNHRMHHFKNEKYWYGVTMLSGDTIMGTAPEADSVALSPTCRTLLD